MYYLLILTPLDFLEVKWLNSHIFMSYVNARTWVKFNGSMNANYIEEECALHLFERLVNLFCLFTMMVKHVHIFTRLIKHFHLFRMMVKHVHLFRILVKPYTNVRG